MLENFVIVCKSVSECCELRSNEDDWTAIVVYEEVELNLRVHD